MIITIRRTFVGLLQLFDAVIVLTSFSLDLVFIQGITGNSEEAIALLIIFLLWRILRIINGTNGKLSICQSPRQHCHAPVS